MTHIELRTRIGPDGILSLSVPMGMSEVNREVKVIVEPADVAVGKTSKMTPEERARFIDETAGAWKGDLERPRRANSKFGISGCDLSPRHECLDCSAWSGNDHRSASLTSRYDQRCFAAVMAPIDIVTADRWQRSRL